MHRCEHITQHRANHLLLSVVAVVRGDSNVKGTVTFEQSSESSPTSISWDITGHDANAERGMHVHQFGDNTNGCTSAGPHCRSSHGLVVVPAQGACPPSEPSGDHYMEEFITDIFDLQSTLSANSMGLQKTTNATSEI